MSLLSRLTNAPAEGDLAGIVASLRAAGAGAPADLLGSQPPAPPEGPTAPGIPTGPVGLGTAAARLASLLVAPPEAPAPGPPSVPAVTPGGQQLYCPGPFRDDPALGDEVDDRLVEWAAEVGIYPGKLDQVRAAGIGRLIMLSHPDSDDPDRLLAAARCALAEWATDDHYVDDPELGADPKLLATRLILAEAVIDPAHLPVRYAPQLEQAVQEDPVLVAYRSSFAFLSQYASFSQVARLHHELSVMFLAYDHEAAWQTERRTPPVWEYLVHRHKNSFIPCMVLIDAVGGYELPPIEFRNPAVRRVFTMAGLASVLVNDLYSMSKEQGDTDYSLPRLIAGEDGVSLEEGIERTVAVHNELMHTVETEAAPLAVQGSPALARFLIGLWAWLGGNHEWHRTSPRYRTDAPADRSATEGEGGSA